MKKLIKIPEIEVYITSKELNRVNKEITMINSIASEGEVLLEVKVKGRPNFNHISNIIKKLQKFEKLKNK